jgi:hypothetical protein
MLRAYGDDLILYDEYGTNVPMYTIANQRTTKLANVKTHLTINYY